MLRAARQPLEPRVPAQRGEVRIDAQPGRRDEVLQSQDLVDVVDRLLLLAEDQVDARTLVKDVGPYERPRRHRAQIHSPIRLANRLGLAS